MDGLKTAVLYSFGCDMGVLTGIDRYFLDFLREPSDSPKQEQTKIRSLLEGLNPYASYCSLAKLMKCQKVFEERVVRAYWLGNGQVRRGLNHNFQVLTKIESVRVSKKLPTQAVNKMLDCLVSFGRILRTRPDKLMVLHYGLLCDRRGDYVWKKEKREIGSGFVNKPEKGKLVSIHISSARENINRSQARLLRETTIQAMKTIAASG